ncbi:MAG: hypothetical protein ACM3WV_08945 [Bacillota bacterium]
MSVSQSANITMNGNIIRKNKLGINVYSCSAMKITRNFIARKKRRNCRLQFRRQYKGGERHPLIAIIAYPAIHERVLP